MALAVLWLVPVAYILHMVEEAPRFVAWTKRYPWLFPSRFNTRLFWIGNGLFMTYVLGSVVLANVFPSSWTLVLGVSTAAWIFANFLVHALTTLTSGVYSPGLVTAGAIYVPTALYVYSSLWQAGILTPETILWSVVVGVAAMYLPFLNSIRVARQERRAAA